MTIFQDQSIPGITYPEKLEKWFISENKIKVHQGLTVKRSDLGGAGIFFKATEDDLKKNEDIELVRIPSHCTLDYMSLLHILEEVKNEEEKNEPKSWKESDIIKHAIRSIEPQGEMEIVFAYIVSFAICKELRHGDYGSNSILHKFGPYLDVLQSTPTIGSPDGDFFQDHVVNLMTILYRRLQQSYQKIKEGMVQLGVGHDQLISLDSYVKIYQAVNSRVLEIPHESYGESQPDEDEFYTNVTLVPFLDFANHNSDILNNAYYDVDRKTQDIILVFKSLFISDKEVEVTICYSPTESIPHFIRTYGFIPENQSVQLLEMKLSDDCIDRHVNRIQGTKDIPYHLIMKWLHISPRYQLVVFPETVYINYFSNNLPLIFVDGLRYDPNWKQIACKKFTDSEADVTESDFNESILPILQEQEDNYDFIVGIDQVAVVIDSTHPNPDSILESVGRTDDQYFEALVAKCTTLIQDVMRESLSCTPAETSTGTPFADLSWNYKAYIDHVLKLLLTAISNGSDVVLPFNLANKEWEITYRTPPKIMDFE